MKQLTILLAVCAMALFITQTANADHGRGGYRGGYGGYGHYHGGYRGFYGGYGGLYGGRPNVAISFGNPWWGGGYYGPGFYGGPVVAPVAPVFPVGGWGPGWGGPGWGRPGCGGGFYYGW